MVPRKNTFELFVHLTLLLIPLKKKKKKKPRFTDAPELSLVRNVASLGAHFKKRYESASADVAHVDL